MKCVLLRFLGSLLWCFELIWAVFMVVETFEDVEYGFVRICFYYSNILEN